MESMEQGKAALISGIEGDAQNEAAKIVQEAKTQVAEKHKYAQKRNETILQEARDKAQQQAEALMKKANSEADMEIKRRSLALQREMLAEIMGRVERKLGTVIDQPGYRDTLLAWVTQAALGLGTEQAEVNASQAERALLDEAFLQEAAARIKAAGGRDVTLTLSQGQPLNGQGISLTAADGRTAYNNQVKTRMSRLQRDIQRMIVDALFTEKE